VKLFIVRDVRPGGRLLVLVAARFGEIACRTIDAGLR
jgi:hypothetical protein